MIAICAWWFVGGIVFSSILALAFFRYVRNSREFQIGVLQGYLATRRGRENLRAAQERGCCFYEGDP